PAPATRADIFVSADGGGVGDRCILTHRDPPTALLNVNCFPLAEPVAPINGQDFTFDLPLPPRPDGVRGVARRLVTYPTPGGGPAAKLRVRRRVFDPEPPARTFLGGSSKVGQRPCDVTGDCRPPTCASCGTSETCLGQGPVTDWAMQAALNGEWQRLTGLEDVTAPGAIAQSPSLVYDQYLRADGQVRIQAHGVSKECVDAMLGKSLGSDLAQFGLTRGLDCLTSRGHASFGGSRSYFPGTIDETYPGPDFGA